MKTYNAPLAAERRTRVVCNLCESDDAEVFLSLETHRYVRCGTCGLVYQDQQPVFDDLKHRYGADYFGYELQNEENFFRLMVLGLGDIDFDRIGGALRGREFLDVGCATGMLLAHMRDRGWNVQGVEICRESAEYGAGERNVPIFVGTLQEAQFPEGFYSAVHCSHLIEHLTDPRQYLREVRRILAPDGYAVVTTPNVDGFQAKVLKERWRSAIADHLYLFSRNTLARMLGDVGFRVLKTVTWGGMAAGCAPPAVKRPLDFLAKRFGFGDVVLFLVGKA